MAGAVARGEQHVDLEARQLEPLAAPQHLIGLVALVGPDPRERDVAHDVGQHRALDLAHVNGRAGLARHRRDRADVVEVGVGEEDRLDLEAEVTDRRQDAFGLVARIEDHGPGGVVPACDEAVLLHRPDREHAHVHDR